MAQPAHPQPEKANDDLEDVRVLWAAENARHLGVPVETYPDYVSAVAAQEEERAYPQGRVHLLEQPFDAHAWIREFEGAGGVLTVAHDSWGSRVQTDDTSVEFADLMGRLFSEVAGEHADFVARREAIGSALRWRSRGKAGAA